MRNIVVQSPKSVIEVGARALTHLRAQAMDIGVTSGVHRAFQMARGASGCLLLGRTWYYAYSVQK